MNVKKCEIGTVLHNMKFHLLIKVGHKILATAFIYSVTNGSTHSKFLLISDLLREFDPNMGEIDL